MGKMIRGIYLEPETEPEKEIFIITALTHEPTHPDVPYIQPGEQDIVWPVERRVIRTLGFFWNETEAKKAVDNEIRHINRYRANPVYWFLVVEALLPGLMRGTRQVQWYNFEVPGAYWVKIAPPEFANDYQTIAIG